MVQQPNMPERVDQATRLREAVARAPRRSAHTIAVVSGKGGVGKTNIAVNLSICLAAKGLRTTLVDMDMGLANADVLMNVRARHTLSHVVSGRRRLDEVVTSGPGGIRFIPGASGFDQFANMSEFERQNLLAWLRALDEETDVLVLDCGAGISRNVISFAACADRVLVITTPQPTAIADAYGTIKVLHREACRGEIALFVNMAENRGDAGQTYKRLAEVATRFLNISIANAGYMLFDKAVEQAVRERTPFVVGRPHSGASACIAALAEEIARYLPKADRGGGFFRRVVGLFA